MEYEEGRQNLVNLLQSSMGGALQRNEATTRLHLVDYLFFDCLGWERVDAVLEEPLGSEFADYTFSSPHRLLIVEAKKEGGLFEVPAGRVRIEYAIPSLFRDYPNLKAAMEQAANYCQTRGVPLAAVCDGHQLVAFVGARTDGLPPLTGKALVFPSLEFALEHFHQVWQALSKPAVEERRLVARLVGDVLPELPRKLSSTIYGYPGIKGRNPFQADLQILSEIVLEDISRSPGLETRFLQECYDQSGALSQYSLVSKHILQARYSAMFADTAAPTTVPATDTRGLTPELVAESLSRRPILLLGDVGVGKSSFIRHLIRIDAAPQFAEAITLYIDLGTRATLTGDLRTFVLDEVASQLREAHKVNITEGGFVRGVYHFALQDFGKGIFGPLRESDPQYYQRKEIEFLAEKIATRDQHLRESLEHLSKARGKQIVVFLDNADQRDDDTQQLAFLMAQEMAQHWPVTVFVSLRPETFYRSTRTGALSGYHAKAFTISPPRIERVIKKRLRFALKLTSGEIPVETLPGSTTVVSTSLQKIIHIFLHSMETNDDLSEFLDNLSGGNVRLALNLVKNFFGSGHVATEKMLKIHEETSSYTIPLHEFLRAVIYGDAVHYDPDRSPIANLFDVTRVDPREHFLLPLLIETLYSLGTTESNDGYVELTRLYERLQGYGFDPDQIDVAVDRGVRSNLVEQSPRGTLDPRPDRPRALRATTVGLYHVSRLARRFTYVDAVIVDTPVFDAAARRSIRDVFPIQERLDRAEVFRRYLDENWRNLEGAGGAFDWNDVSAALDAEMREIRDRLSRPRGSVEGSADPSSGPEDPKRVVPGPRPNPNGPLRPPRRPTSPRIRRHANLLPGRSPVDVRNL